MVRFEYLFDDLVIASNQDKSAPVLSHLVRLDVKPVLAAAAEQPKIHPRSGWHSGLVSEAALFGEHFCSVSMDHFK